MRCEVFFLVFGVQLFTRETGSVALVVRSINDAQIYLARFGYMQRRQQGSTPSNDTLNQQSMLKKSLMSFQLMAGIYQSGVLDAKTMEMMNTPRCGLPDNIGTRISVLKRRRRYVLNSQGSRWNKRALTYNILTYSKKISQGVTRTVMSRAFKLWSDVTPLRFTEGSRAADIRIRFAVSSHGDSSPFDGPSGVLAHAYFPSSGIVHFDDDESWTDASSSGKNLLQVATHEFGHALGLDHSPVKGAVMAPYYTQYTRDFRLSPDDVRGMQHLYGARSSSNFEINTISDPSLGSKDVPAEEFPEQDPSICRDASIDAIFTIGSKTYAFKGDVYYVLDNDDLKIGRPYLINDTWPHVTGPIDTAFYLQPFSGQLGQLFFFKGDKYWIYEEFNRLSAKYSLGRKISEGFQGVPDNLDAAFVWGDWSVNGTVYFIKGDKYYRCTRSNAMNSGYPRSMSVWSGVPTPVGTVFTWSDNQIYFFIESQFYRFDVMNLMIEDEYPRSTALVWFGCANAGVSTARRNLSIIICILVIVRCISSNLLQF